MRLKGGPRTARKRNIGSAVCFFALLAGGYSAYAQPSAKLEFEAASIKPSPPPTGGWVSTGFCRGGPGTNDPGLYTCGDTSLSALIMEAYGANFWQISTPDWMVIARFDLRAVVPQETTKEQLAIMLQNLLAERFKLVVHHESREIQSYELVVAKNGPKFKEHVATKTDDASKGAVFSPGPPARDKDGYLINLPRGGMAVMGDKAGMYWLAMTMETLAARLSEQLGGRVTDATGLTGKYDISLHWVPGNGMSASPPGGGPTPAGNPGPTLTEALQDQLGLRVESKKGPVDFLVVDHAEKVPTEN